ncbi:hypothetical protein SAMN05421737_11370 [Shouchella lonarensis]|uniref:Uncharacterized protein n=1 Tax=Shouchella lonarensis TaxID=1464122 RepID=A0A1G6NUD3_9BACI|nr:hypothetical protein SAMN05421737_11370 [Shouchella lonarensis]
MEKNKHQTPIWKSIVYVGIGIMIGYLTMKFVL